MGSIAVELEKAGIPVFVIQNDRYEQRMMAAVQELGYPDVAHFMADEELEYTAEGGTKLADIVYPLAVEGLTKWSPPYLKLDNNKWVPKDDSFTFTGATYDEALAKFSAKYLGEMFWGDGLPLVPPTKEKVDAMLAATPMTPTLVMAKWGGSGAEYTVEKIAINAVMAGAQPVHFPIILAAMEAITSQKWQNQTWVVKSPSPLIIVNGPVAQQAKVNSGAAAFGANPKYPANGAIGRAVNLAMRNIGGIGRGLQPSNLAGAPAQFAGMVVAEAEDVMQYMPAGWDPLNVQLGAKKGTNTVTVLGIEDMNFSSSGSFLTNTVHYVAPNSAAWPSTIEAFKARTAGVVVLTELVAAIQSKLIPDPLSLAKVYVPTKAAVAEYFYKNARIPRAEFNKLFLTDAAGKPVEPKGSMAEVLKGLKPDEDVPIAAGPDKFLVLVTGGH